MGGGGTETDTMLFSDKPAGANQRCQQEQETETDQKRRDLSNQERRLMWVLVNPKMHLFLRWRDTGERELQTQTQRKCMHQMRLRIPTDAYTSQSKPCINCSPPTFGWDSCGIHAVAQTHQEHTPNDPVDSVKATKSATKVLVKDIETQTQPSEEPILRRSEGVQVEEDFTLQTKQLQQQVSSLLEQNTKLLSDLKELENKKEDAEKDIQYLQNKLQKVQEEYAICRPSSVSLNERENVKMQLNYLEKHVQEQNDKLSVEREKRETSDRCLIEEKGRISKLQQQVANLNKEKEQLLQRLSKISSDKLIDGNPAIADLSDDRRPTKLAEIFSELYDNEWTEAFDEQTREVNCDEYTTIQTLLEILLTTHERCQTHSKGYLDNLTKAACGIQQRQAAQPLPQAGLNGDVPLEIKKKLRDIRKIFAPSIRHEILEELEEEWNIRKILIKASTRAYILKCLDLCWDMSVKDPPVVLMSLPEVGSDYDKDRYRFYTESETKVGYVVWPGMLLHEGGPTLAKGVVQGIKVS